MRKQRQWAMVIGCVLSVAAAPAWAGSYCSTSTPCKDANETCQGSYCVPSAKLCTGDSACQTWEKCDFTCPGGMNGSSTGSGGTSSSDASISVSSDGISWTDGGSWSSTDAGSSGSGSYDAGSGNTPEPYDASMPWNPDGMGVPKGDAWYPTMDIDQPYNPCPASPGVCVAVLSKVPAQAGCEAFCSALVPCNLSFANGSTSGGSGGGVPPSADAGSSDPSYPDAMPGTDQAPDAAASYDTNDLAPDAEMSYDTNMPQYDGGPIDPGPDAQAQCVAMCSVWVLDKVGTAELTTLEQCVTTQLPSGCSAIEKNCETQAKALMAELEAHDAWSLGMGGSLSTSGGTTGGTKDVDASPVFDNADAAASMDSGSGAPQQFGDTVGGNSNGAASADTGSTAPKSGCTAGTNAQAAPLSLAILGLLASTLVLRRRRSF